MKPLGYTTYFKKHKKRIAAIVATICICIILIGELDIITKNMMQTQERDFTKYKYFTLISPLDWTFDKDTLLKIQTRDGVNKVIRVASFDCSINTLGSQAEFKSFIADEENIKYLMKIMKLNASLDQVPKNDTDSIILNESISKAFKVNLGDFVDPAIHKVSSLSKTYKVSGVISDNNIAAFIPASNETLSKLEGFKEEYLVVFDSSKMSNVNSFLKDISKDKFKVTDFDERVRFITTIFKNSDSIINILIIITIIFLSIVLGNYSYVHYIHRRREFGILKALGYTRSRILIKIGLEISVTTFSAMVLGISVLLIINNILNSVYVLKIGLAPLKFTLGLFPKLIPIPLSISIFTFIPVSRMIEKIDAISIIERIG